MSAYRLLFYTHFQGDVIMFIFENPNPGGSYVGDCVVRAISIATGKSWDEVFIELCLQGFKMHDMPSSNRVWNEYLKSKSFTRHIIPDTCPDCYTVRDFCGEHFKGTYILGTGSHVIAVKDGSYHDTWDSGDETPIWYWTKEE